ncbi:MAG: hypothetical protein ABSH10_09445 [Phycisphaerae bacterium]|jgi:hypothetical protein
MGNDQAGHKWKFGDMPRSGGHVQFGGKPAALIGVLGGTAIAVGLSALTLLYGQHLGAVSEVIIIILAVLFGAGLAIVSAVLGIVIPTTAGGGDYMPKIKKLNVEKNKDGTKRVHLETGGGDTETAASSSDNETG